MSGSASLRDRLNATVRDIPRSGIRDFFEIVSTMKDVISLGIGDPDTPTYGPIVEAAQRAVADGDGPKEVNGFFLVRTANGDAPNPLWQFDGNVDLLPPAPKGEFHASNPP